MSAEILRGRVAADDRFVSDFAMIRLDTEAAENLRCVPTRKGGGFDARYAASKKAEAWMRRAHNAIAKDYMAGAEFGPDYSIPLEPFRL